jgi:hypothetical protein
MVTEVNNFALGDEVKDVVTGFQGVATGIHKWFTGCDSVTIAPPAKNDVLPSTQAFDVTRVVLVKARAAEKSAMKKAKGTLGAG